MACPITTQDLIQHCGLEDACLEREVAREYFQDLSWYLSEWERLAPLLNISHTEVDDIDRENPKPEKKRGSFLKLWKQKMSIKATYRALIDSLLRIGRGDDAKGVCQVLQQSELLSKYC